MPSATNHRVRAKVVCRSGHEHDVCISVPRDVHPDLRCPPDASQGFGPGGGGCVLPDNLLELAEREIRDHYQESRRRGWLLIAS
jgi:hypothetical protein